MWIDDQMLASCANALFMEVWVPDSAMIVLGRSNKASRELLKSRCESDGIPILKRLGGGGTVLLHPGCLVISVGIWVRDYYQNDLYFRLLNQSIIETLRSKLPAQEFSQRGYSDIVLGERKIAGTSLFRSRNYLLYQASLLVDVNIELIEKYLAHPSAEPDYRQGRSHRDFLMGLGELGEGSVKKWREYFTANLSFQLAKNLSQELIEPPLDQIKHVKGRIGENHSLE